MDKTICLADAVRVKREVLKPSLRICPVVLFVDYCRFLFKHSRGNCSNVSHRVDDAPPAGKGQRNIYT